MKKNIQILLAGLIAAAMVLAPAAGIAQEKPKAAPGSDAQGKGPGVRPVPFRGTVTAVDAAAKTVTIKERVFHISSESKLTKNGQTATVGDIAVADMIVGNFTTGSDGKLMAQTVRVVPKQDQAPGETSPKPKKPAEKTKANEAQGSKEAKE